MSRRRSKDKSDGALLLLGWATAAPASVIGTLTRTSRASSSAPADSEEGDDERAGAGALDSIDGGDTPPSGGDGGGEATAGVADSEGVAATAAPPSALCCTVDSSVCRALIPFVRAFQTPSAAPPSALCCTVGSSVCRVLIPFVRAFSTLAIMLASRKEFATTTSLSDACPRTQRHNMKSNAW